ncbi:MAG: hypothetical protein M9921_00630 [Fimbriimonadaceae bacterium]|nr:hypothetical protein [Chthonomonadaceae bacterium]MCO5295339.1 hypothetical protein [Fimbriimonadaceae bacterium]
MERAVFTVALGRPPFAEMAMGLGRSLSLAGDTTPRIVMTDIEGYDWGRYFDRVVPPPHERDGLEKLAALEYTEARHVLALDCDMLAFKRLDPIFEFCRGSALAVQGWMISSGTWHGIDIGPTLKDHGRDALPKFNGGMIYMERGPECEAIVARSREIANGYDATGFARYRKGLASEEICLMLAMLDRPGWTLVPEDRDFQNTASGLIGFPSIDIRKGRCRYLVRSNRVRRVEPILFHALSLRHFPVYWHQLDALKRLERYEDRHPQGYTPPWRTWARTVYRFIYRHISHRL